MIYYDMYSLKVPSALIYLLHRPLRPPNQNPEQLASILEALHLLYVSHRVVLHLYIRGILLQDVDEHPVGRVCVDVVDCGEREFAFR